MNLIYNQTYTFSYVETFLSRNGKAMFRVSLDGEMYSVVARKYQINNPPKELVCRVKDIEENGYVRLSQEITFLLRDYYKPGVSYDFKVISEVSSASGLPCYTLFNEDTELEHKYFARDESDFLEVGQTVSRQTQVKEDKYGIPRLFFYQDDQDFAQYTPEKVFSEISHKDLYDAYFRDLLPETNEIAVIFDEMNEKIETENRLWVFDYIKLLTYWSYIHPIENLQRASDCNVLIIEIENWIQNSGLLNRFSSENREEVLLKIKTTIRKSLEALEILQAISQGTLDQILDDILNSVREKGSESCEAAFSKLIRLIYINPDVVETHFRTIAEFILLTANRIADEDALNMILKSFRRRIWSLKKQINASIHYQRSKEFDRDQLIDMVLGLGALLYLLSDSIEPDKPGIDIPATFAEFCKYLALLTDEERASALVNKSLEYVMGASDSISFDPSLLAGISDSPEPFIDNLLQIWIEPDKMVRATTTASCQMQYRDGHLLILPTESRIRSLQPVTPVYDIPGTPITIASGKEGATPWETEEDLPYYNGCWNNLQRWGQTETLPSEEESVIIRVKPVNTLPNFVFCSIDGPKGGGQDGVIQNKGYLPRAFVDDPNAIFEAGMRFRCKFHMDARGRISFSIADALKEHSKQVAKHSESKQQIGVCFCVEHPRCAFFITTKGVVCSMSLSMRSSIRIAVGQAYVLFVDPERDLLGYPSASPISEAQCSETATELLKRQLWQIAVPDEEEPWKDLSFKQMPHVLLIVDQYLRLAQDDRTRYNLYRAMNLIASAEGSQLVEYYRSRISYMEQLSAFASGEKIDDSFDDPDITSRFPSLKEQEENLSVLSAFGEEDDMDYLFNAANRGDQDPNTTKLARLVLASNLVSHYNGPEELLDGLRRFIVSELGATSFIGSADDVIDYVGPTEDHEERAVTFYGSENQTQEFKTSIVFSPETSLPDADNQMNVIMRTICGFLNAKGGVLWIGVDDSGHAHGIAADLKELNCGTDRYERILRQSIVSMFGKDVNGTISCDFIKDGECDICKLTIPSYSRPVAIHNEFFQRQGNETRIIKGNDLVLFIERKMMEKQPLVMPTEKGPADDTPIESLSSPISVPTPATENMPAVVSSSVWLNTFIDGTYIISEERIQDRRILYSIALPGENALEFSLLLCYDDGTVNRVPVDGIVNKKRNYYYNNGVFKGASFMTAILAKDSDTIIVASEDGSAPLACCSVSEVPSQTMLGMKGFSVVEHPATPFSWMVGGKEMAVSSSTKPTSETKSVSEKPLSPHDKIIRWFSAGRQAELQEWLKNLPEDDIPIVRKAVAEIYLSRDFKEAGFWPLTIALLDSNAKLFRKPISDAVKGYSDYGDLKCSDEDLNHAVKLLLSDKDKVHQGMDFLIPFKSILTKEARLILASNAKHINTPDGFHTLFFLMGASFQEKLNVFETIQDNLAAHFVTFEVLSNDEEENGIWHVQSAANLDTILSAMKGSLGGEIIYRLIRKTVFHDDNDMSDKEAEELIAGGFEGISRQVVLRESQEKDAQAVRDMPSYEGKELLFSVNKVYKNHYFVLHPRYRALLPIQYSHQVYNEGDELTAKVVKAIPRNKLFLITQKSASAKQLEAVNVVDVGDIVEVRFNISPTTGVLVPNVQGYSILHAEVIDYPRDFDYKKRYRAEVVNAHLTFCRLTLKEAVV